jgi:hypothetical protein
MSRETDIAWAAGLFEGEGYITTNYKGRSPSFGIGMTDEDVVLRFTDIVGIDHKRIRSRPPGIDKRTKVLYELRVNRREDVDRVIDMFLPYLGNRRRERAIRALEMPNLGLLYRNRGSR